MEKSPKNKIKIKIQASKDESHIINILSSEFVEKNKKICKIEINSIEEDLTNKFNIKDIQITNSESEFQNSNIPMIYKDNVTFQFSLICYDDIVDMNSMFKECSSLISILGIENLVNNKVTNISHMFENCTSLNFIPGISEWDISNISDISYLFNNCFSLEFLPDISKWNTKSLTNISHLFHNCSSLKKLPDLSKWNTTNITDISYTFYSCASLNFLPDISFWKTDKLTKIEVLFSE